MKRVGMLVVGIIVLGLVGFLLTTHATRKTVAAANAATDQPRLGGGAGPLTVVAPPGPVAPSDPGSFSAAQARVYAALGEVADARREQLPNFDAEARAVVEAMRRLLVAQPLRRGEGRPTVSPTGATSSISNQRGPLPPPADAVKVEGSVPADNLPPVTLADGARQRALGASAGTVTSGPDGHVITGHEAWAAIKAKPGQGLPVRITDRGDGGHVIALFGDDFGSVRVNGGLVVPGRYYRINGSVEITSLVPLGVHIRPLSAVPSYHDQPLLVPSANG